MHNEPTQAMIDAGVIALEAYRGSYGDSQLVAVMFRAMMAAGDAVQPTHVVTWADWRKLHRSPGV